MDQQTLNVMAQLNRNLQKLTKAIERKEDRSSTKNINEDFQDVMSRLQYFVKRQVLAALDHYGRTLPADIVDRETLSLVKSICTVWYEAGELPIVPIVEYWIEQYIAEGLV